VKKRIVFIILYYTSLQFPIYLVVENSIIRNLLILILIMMKYYLIYDTVK